MWSLIPSFGNGVSASVPKTRAVFVSFSQNSVSGSDPSGPGAAWSRYPASAWSATTRSGAVALDPRSRLRSAPRPRVPEPQGGQDVERRLVRAVVREHDALEDLRGRRLRVRHVDRPVAVVVEDARVEQLELRVLQAATVVDELLVRERGLRIVVPPAEQRVARQPLEVPPVLLDVLAVVALRPGQAEHALLEDRIAAVPERERQAQLVADVRDAGHAVLVPAVGARPRVVVRERGPGVAALGVVLADGAPGPLAEIRAPLVPRVRREEVVLGAARRLREPAVLGGRLLRRHGWMAFGESMGVTSKRCQCHGGSETYIPVTEVLAAPLVSPAVGGVVEKPRRAEQVVPGKRDVALRRLVAEVHDDELARGSAPAPADELRPRVVSVPPRSLGTRPLALAEDAVAEERQQALVERPQVLVDRLLGSAAEEDGKLHPPAVELPLVDESRAGLAQRRDGGRARLRRRKRCCRARLVVVLDEPNEAALVLEVGAEVPVYLLGALVHQTIVEALVVAVVEALLLERPLHVPVRLGDEDEVGTIGLHGRDHRRPVVVLGSRAGALPPGPLEDVVRHEHRHVAADAVALGCEGPERRRHGVSEAGREGVELDDVRPGGEVRVAAVRDDDVADADERRRLALEVRLVAPDEVLRVVSQPRMVGRDMVGNEVEDQPEPVPGERLAGDRQPLGAAEASVRDVVADAVRRADDVGRREVGQGTPEALEERRVLESDGDPRRAPLPHTHQPDGIEPERGDRLPLGVRDASEIDRSCPPAGSAHRARPRC